MASNQINSVLDTMNYVLSNKGNHIRNLTKFGQGRAADDKLYNELLIFNKKTFNQLQPFLKGRFIFVPGDMPEMMKLLYPNETAFMKVLFAGSLISVSGFEDYQLEVADVNAMTDQNSSQYVSKLTGKTNQLTLTFTAEYTTLPIHNYITTWMHLIYAPGSSAAQYPHLTGLEYHEGNHSMTAVYVVTNPSYQVVETGAVLYGMVPTNNLGSNMLESQGGEHSLVDMAIQFKVHAYTTALPNVMEICKKTLDDYVNRTAIVDFRVATQPTANDFVL